MEIYFKRPQDGMPEEYVAVLMHLERNKSEEGRVEWAIGYYDGSRWCFDVPREFFDHAKRYTDQEIPSGDDIIDVGFRRVTHWAEIPQHPEFNVVRLSDVPRMQPPSVRFNREENLVEIFGGSSAYSEENPYYLERDRFATRAAALKSMAHLAGKTWATEDFMHQLARILEEALIANVEQVSRSKPN